MKQRYQQGGIMSDLNQAIDLQEQALQLQSPDHPNRSSSLDNLSMALHERYKQSGNILDLNQAIILAEQGLKLCPIEHSLHTYSLNNLAIVILK